jgi:hypothetical protein
VPARQRLLAAVAGLTVGTPLLTPARSIPQMLAAALVAGFAISPTLSPVTRLSINWSPGGH